MAENLLACPHSLIELRFRQLHSNQQFGLTNATNQAEHDNLTDGDDPDGLTEVVGIFHLGDETWQGDLANEGVTNVQEGIHAGNEGGARQRNRKDQRLATDFLTRSIDVVGVRVVAGGAVLALSTCEGGGEDDADEGEQSCTGGQLRKSVEGARHGAKPGHNGADRGEADGADAVVCKYGSVHQMAQGVHGS